MVFFLIIVAIICFLTACYNKHVVHQDSDSDSGDYDALPIIESAG